ncbi:MAG: TraM recognition domain-containing protein [Deltaproteobacteria bacterium]|jgi:hypothetical protein|nr:TraM recognition domain-containing protein [Deltaproteobacteria bacterium]
MNNTVGKEEEKPFWGIAKEINSDNKGKIYLSDKYHTIVFGQTGSGKTESVLLQYWKNIGSVSVIDGKGEVEAMLTAKRIRPTGVFYTFDSTFNLLKGLKPKEIAELISNALYPKEITTAEYYYKNFAIQALSFVLKYMDNPTFEKIFISLYKENIAKLYARFYKPKTTAAANSKKSENASMIIKNVSDIAEITDSQNITSIEKEKLLSKAEELIIGGLIKNPHYDSYIAGFLDNLQPFALAKNLNSEDADNIDFAKANWFGLRNIKEENDLGRMIIENLRLRKVKKPDYKVTLCVDEFADLMFAAFSKIIKEIRSFGVQLVMLTQTLSDADRFDRNLLNIMFGNSDNKIFFKQDTLRNEDIAKLFGTDLYNHESKTIDNTGTKINSMSESREYNVQPHMFGELLPGNAIAKLLIPDKKTGLPIVKKVFISFNNIRIERNLN